MSLRGRRPPHHSLQWSPGTRLRQAAAPARPWLGHHSNWAASRLLVAQTRSSCPASTFRRKSSCPLWQRPAARLALAAQALRLFPIRLGPAGGLTRCLAVGSPRCCATGRRCHRSPRVCRRLRRHRGEERPRLKGGLRPGLPGLAPFAADLALGRVSPTAAQRPETILSETGQVLLHARYPAPARAAPAVGLWHARTSTDRPWHDSPCERVPFCRCWLQLLRDRAGDRGSVRCAR